LISVKALADGKRMIFAAMSTRRIHAFRMSTAVKWRRVLFAALMFVVGFAPVAKVACDLDALAAQLGGPGTALATALGAHFPHDDDGTCCDHEPGAFVAPAKLPAADATLVLSPVGVQVALAEIGFVTMTAVLGPTGRRYPAPPPEPVFRRVPRLLI
jgi:hypothetical protein